MPWVEGPSAPFGEPCASKSCTSRVSSSIPVLPGATLLSIPIPAAWTWLEVFLWHMQWEKEDLSLIPALTLSPSPSPPTPIALPGMIDVPHPAWLQYIHCHAEGVVSSLLVFHIELQTFFNAFLCTQIPLQVRGWAQST